MKSLNREERQLTLTTGNLREVMSLDKWVNEHEPFYKNNTEPMLVETDQIPIEKMNRIKEIMAIPMNAAPFCSRAFVKRLQDGFHIYFYMVLGKNGHGRAFDDLGAATAVLGMLENRTEFASFIQAERDCADDISYWSMTFVV